MSVSVAELRERLTSRGVVVLAARVAQEHYVTLDDVLTHSRRLRRRIVEARWHIWAAIRAIPRDERHPLFTLVEIGWMFDVHNTTVMDGVNRIMLRSPDRSIGAELLRRFGHDDEKGLEDAGKERTAEATDLVAVGTRSGDDRRPESDLAGVVAAGIQLQARQTGTREAVDAAPVRTDTVSTHLVDPSRLADAARNDSRQVRRDRHHRSGAPPASGPTGAGDRSGSAAAVIRTGGAVIPVLPVAQLSRREQTFFCEPLAVKCSAGSCIDRQAAAAAEHRGISRAAAEGRILAGRLRMCLDCPLGKQVAAQVTAGKGRAA